MKAGQEVTIKSTPMTEAEGTAGAKGIVSGTVSADGKSDAPMGWVTVPEHPGPMLRGRLHPDGVRDGDWALTDSEVEPVAEAVAA